METILLAAAVFVLLAVVLGVVALRMARPRGDTLEQLARTQAELGAQLKHLSDQNVTAIGQISERLQQQERDLTKNLDARLAEVTRRVGETLQKQTAESAATMGDLKERLGTIKAAQDNITKLSQQVVSLQDVLTNKQARGAFGETQLMDLVQAALPPNAYAFQQKLSNGKMADCLLRLPRPPGPIAVDAKFPLESYNTLRAAADETGRIAARKAFSADALKHVKDIAEKYIIPGETADSALMFVPSEAVFAEIHAELVGVVEQSHRSRVYIVSPTTMMATLHTIRAVLRDAQMKEQAGVIQKEVQLLGEDAGRLDKRVDALQRHFHQAEEDVRQIRTSAEKIAKRSDRIAEVDLGESDVAEALQPPAPAKPEAPLFAAKKEPSETV